LSSSPDKNWRMQTIGIVVPSFLTLLLFIFGYFFVLLPSYKNSLIEKKEQHLKEMTSLAIKQAHALIADYSLNPEYSPEEKLLLYFEELRHGTGEDQYFWILDTSGTMLMHPHIKQYEGQNLLDYRDPSGRTVFKNMVDVVRNQGNGMVEYSWAYGSDTSRIEEKRSYVTRINGSDWILGTGLYEADLIEETKKFTNRLTFIALGVFFIIFALILYLSHKSLLVEKKRAKAEKDREELLVHLTEALERVQQLGGLLPICSKCKKIRDDRGYWQEVELYIRDHTDAEFTHGLCPTCQDDYFKELEETTELIRKAKL